MRPPYVGAAAAPVVSVRRMDGARSLRQLAAVARRRDGEAGGRSRTLTRLPGGASRETWSFSARGPDGVATRLVLRRDPPGAPVSGLRLEAALLRAAAQRRGPGAAASSWPGRPPAGSAPTFMIMDFVEGETIPRRILRDEHLARVRPVLAEQCGAALAADPPHLRRSRSPAWPAVTPLEQLRGLLDRLGQPHPAFELGLRWLAETASGALGRGRWCTATSATAT